MHTDKEKIPKIIHYCWYGGKSKPKLVRDCIASWKECLYDYQVVEWNEKNTDLSHPFVKEAYFQKKWAFVSDFVRLKVLYENGGVYLDVDMMIVKSINDLLVHSCFFGAEEIKIISGGIIGSEKNHAFIKVCLDNYDLIKLNETINFNEMIIPKLLTSTYMKFYEKSLFEKIVETNSLVIYPSSYFYPLPNKKKNDVKNYKKYVQHSTFAVHLWNASWVEYDEFYYLRNKKYIKALFKIMNKICFKRDINLYYFKRMYYNFLKSFK
ncbi:glycosyltransferase family 32 protein [Flavobacterium undicola]|uniref:glycosyltransferase family 32 protein n=1 Tax=Flavobacterium undicola TaxID=1932779 RepID=UPI00137682F3|nr:glycosyltransferase [Flavobacterium undicola]MBA0884750.1 glycosyltransferase [Flavobacterium undicola]